jgi:glycosyltransferase involved in cell wall biosynthesis
VATDVRVLHVIQELRGGGAERIVVTLAAAAEARGEEAAVVASGSPDGKPPVRTYPLPLVERRPWRLAPAAAAVRAAVRDFRPDVLHAHNPTAALASAWAVRRGARTPALVTMHGVPEDEYPRAGRVLRLSGLQVVACGPGVAAALRETGVPVRAMIANCIAPAPPAADRTRLTAEWNVPQSHRLAVAVGRLAHQKNHALAIQALAHIPRVTLAIVGTGPLRNELEEKAASAGVADRVVLTGARTDARSIMAAADVVVLPSRWEGLPLVGLEALAAGTPLVATSVRGVRELLRDGVDSMLAPPGDARALADGLRRVLEEPELADRLRQEGLRVAAAYREDAMVHAYWALYEELRR